MATARLKYIKAYTDRLGTRRHYFNKIGRPSVALPGLPGSAEFMEAYQSCLDDVPAPKPRVVLQRPTRGSITELVAKYYASAAFKTLGDVTKSTYRNEIRKIERAYGAGLVRDLQRVHIKKIVAAKAEKPGAANKLLRTLKMLMKFAVDEEMRADDPTAGLKPLKVPGDGFRAWSEDDIEKFEKRHPIGSKPRLALALCLYTAQRRGDVVRMGWQHIRDGVITLHQQKTGTCVEIPIHPKLQAVIECVPKQNPTLLLSETGAPYKPTTFGNWFGDRCREAGLPTGYNAHGLRKAGARRLAEAGCTTLEIMSITGHQSIGEVERYTRSASRKRLAAEGMAKLEARPV